MQIEPHPSRDLLELLRLERRAFAAKLRMARALLGWSQSDLGARVGLTQRAIHKIEQGETEPRRATVRAIEEVWRAQGLDFEDLADGGFRVSVHSALLAETPAVQKPRQKNSAVEPLSATHTYAAARYRA